MSRKCGKREVVLFCLFWVMQVFFPPANAGEINMVVSGAFVSQQGIPVYEALARYVEDKLGRKTDMISGLSYTETSLLLKRGIVHVGFINSLPYVHGQAQGEMDLLVIPIIATRTNRQSDSASYTDVPGKYFSYTIVRKDSPLNSWSDLRGKRYVYNSLNSNSGYNMPRYKLVKLGAKSWGGYFAQVQVSGSHEESIRLVARGLADASSVDSLILDYMRSVGDADALNVKVIDTLFPGGVGAPPVVVTKKIDPALRTALQKILLNMDKDPEGKRILSKALLERFALPNDTNYDDVRAMEAAAVEAKFRDLTD